MHFQRFLLVLLLSTHENDITGFLSNSLLTCLQHGHHFCSHCFPDVHICLGVAAVVSARAAAHRERVRVHGRDVARKFRVLGGIGHAEHGVQHEAVASRGALHSLSQGRRDELGVRRAVLDAELLDESDEIFLVLVGQTHIARVFVALPPEEAGNRVALLAWVECGDVAEYLVGGADWKGRS